MPGAPSSRTGLLCTFARVARGRSRNTRAAAALGGVRPAVARPVLMRAAPLPGSDNTLALCASGRPERPAHTCSAIALAARADT
eukprot:8891046-Alexandrium_andersonii.AAC.1